MNYYNEHDPKAAAWLRVLISENLIPKGEVDERDIQNVRATELAGYRQCHFFAGIGGWSLALRLAGWPDDKPVWTGSCPCQPFSCAGKGKAHADERHLWPEMFRLIRECRPHIVFGEQVENAIVHGWLDGISADLEGEGYAIGTAVLGAHSVRAPHKRQRLYWCAVDGQAVNQGQGWPGVVAQLQAGEQQRARPWGSGSNDRMADAELNGRRPDEPGRRPEGRTADGWDCEDAVALGDSIQPGLEGHARDVRNGHETGRVGENTAGPVAEAGAVVWMAHSGHGPGCPEQGDQLQECDSRIGESGAWDNSRIIRTRDGKQRRIPHVSESVFQRLADGLSTHLDALRSGGLSEAQVQEAVEAMRGFPLSASIPKRVALLRGYGNAIVPQLAAEFIRACLDVIDS